VICSWSGQEAIELCRDSLFDVVLLDLRLPDVDGLEVLQQIKSDSPQTSVILITAHGDVETAVKAMQLRADNFVLKPVDLKVIETIVSKVSTIDSMMCVRISKFSMLPIRRFGEDIC
jgi:DNA-binding NtrC family response regulator